MDTRPVVWSNGMQARSSCWAAFALVALASHAGLAAPLSEQTNEETSGDRSHAELYTRTEEVEALALDAAHIWVATRGGLEAYDRASLKRHRLYTTADGLDDNHVRGVTVAAPGGLSVRTLRSSCQLDAKNARFTCTAAPPLPAPLPHVAERFQTQRITARLAVSDAGPDARLVGTAQDGLWLDRGPGTAPRRLTPRGQICSNHIMAMARFQGRRYFGSFDQGLCLFDDRSHRFRTVSGGAFRMVNDLLVHRGVLYVGASEGLYRSRDGRQFERVDLGQVDGAINRLAADARFLYATTPSALVRLQGRRQRTFWRPAGTRSLQSVTLAGDAVWLVAEDRGLIQYTGESGGAFVALDRLAGLPTSWMLDVAATEDGRVYAASLRHGLIERRPDGSHRVVSGLPSPWLLRVVRDAAGTGVWVGTQNGAVHLDAAGQVTPLAGIAHPVVHAFLDGPDGVWVGSEGGTTWHAANVRPDPNTVAARTETPARQD